VGQRQGFIARPANRPMGEGLELFARRKNGTEVPVDIMLSPVQLPDSELVISVIRDVTERIKTTNALKDKAEELTQSAEQLARSNKELEMFAYVASHDLQEPLRAVASSCQILEKRLGDKLDGDTREFLQFAVDGARRMRTLIDDLLAFSRIARGDQRKETPLEAPIGRALENLKTTIEESHAKITVTAALPPVLVDQGQLVQVFQNLVANALKFHEPGVAPRVEIGARRDGDMVLCWVKDFGIGMEPRFHERIFTIFHRLHSRERFPGTGIGLAICKIVIERHGGRIWVESAAGAGATFYFTVSPAAQEMIT
jgi:light-regulated signal transduction histidine kinase (bacteriophytochrome)